MGSDTPALDTPQSPFDPFISQLMTLIATEDHLSFSELNQLCVREFHWLQGFCDVVINILRTNGLIQVFEWEPGRVHISERGRRWTHATRESISLI
jgi:hypothetical protein